MEFLAIVRGAIAELTEAHNWVKHGTLTPEQAAAAYFDMFDRFLSNEGMCRVIGEVILYAGTTNPYPDKWVVCDGTEQLVADYPDLYAVIGHLYGDHDSTHFWLPSLSLHVPMGAQPDNGYPIGMYLGSNLIEVREENLPAHMHMIPATTTDLAVGGGELVVLVPSEGYTLTDEQEEAPNDPIEAYPPSVLMTYYIVAKEG